MHGVLYLPISFKQFRLQASYKYVSYHKGPNFELISRPKIYTEHQGLLDRTLIIRQDDWKGMEAIFVFRVTL